MTRLAWRLAAAAGLLACTGAWALDLTGHVAIHAGQSSGPPWPVVDAPAYHRGEWNGMITNTGTAPLPVWAAYDRSWRVLAQVAFPRLDTGMFALCDGIDCELELELLPVFLTAYVPGVGNWEPGYIGDAYVLASYPFHHYRGSGGAQTVVDLRGRDQGRLLLGTLLPGHTVKLGFDNTAYGQARGGHGAWEVCRVGGSIDDCRHADDGGGLLAEIMADTRIRFETGLAVPEPAPLVSLGLGLGALVLIRLRRPALAGLAPMSGGCHEIVEPG
ncbi:MAG: PEP-CTERM sorting domain-containing protein [Aquabacterium sp.]